VNGITAEDTFCTLFLGYPYYSHPECMGTVTDIMEFAVLSFDTSKGWKIIV